MCWQPKLQRGEPMDQWIDGSIESMDVWFDGLMKGSINKSMHWLMDLLMNRLING